MPESSAASSVMSQFRLDGKVAVITGAGSGIGKAIAAVFVEAGAKVMIADLNADAAKVVAHSLNSRHGGTVAAASAANVADEASVVQLFNQTASTLGAVDCLVNCAGIYEHTSFLDTPVEKIHRVLAVNTVGTYLCMRAAIRSMRATGKGGAIVNISSVASKAPIIYDNNDYGASKAGVNNLTVTTALEFAPDKIRINAVLPGGVATERASQSTEGHVIRGPATQPGRMPLGRLATPEEIALTVLFLCSPAAGYITGQLLAVDGGFLIS